MRYLGCRFPNLGIVFPRCVVDVACVDYPLPVGVDDLNSERFEHCCIAFTLLCRWLNPYGTLTLLPCICCWHSFTVVPTVVNSPIDCCWLTFVVYVTGAVTCVPDCHWHWPWPLTFVVVNSTVRWLVPVLTTGDTLLLWYRCYYDNCCVTPLAIMPIVGPLTHCCWVLVMMLTFRNSVVTVLTYLLFLLFTHLPLLFCCNHLLLIVVRWPFLLTLNTIDGGV